MGNLEIVDSGRSLTSNGLTYVGGQLKSSAALIPTTQSTFTVNGGLVFGTTSGVPLASTYKVKTTLNYNADKAKAPDVSTALRSAKGVSIVRWGLP
jgi:ATP phosphoribosyltransferase